MRTVSVLLFAALATATLQAGQLPDPMRPSYGQQALPRALARREFAPQLQGVFGDAKQRIAVLDGQIIEIGSLVGAFRVTNIHADSIELRHGKRRVVARIGAAK